MDEDMKKLIEREKANNWIELNKKSINNALSFASMSFSPKNDLEGLGRHETDDK